MKKLISLFILFAIVLITIVSCKKTNSGSQTSRVHLSKFVAIDTTLSAPNDTLEINSYTYDNSGRWIYEVDVSPGTNGYADIVDSANKSIVTYYYLGSATLPYMYGASEYSQGVFQDSTINYLLSYSGEEVLKDSDATTTTQWQYNGSIVTDIYTYLGSASYDTAIQTKVNGNIIEQINPSNYGDGNFTASYDTHPDPFPTANFYITGFPSLPDNIDFGQNNNLTEISGVHIYNQQPVHTKFTYTYNVNGYPATVVAYDWTSGSPVFSYKGIFVYQ